MNSGETDQVPAIIMNSGETDQVPAIKITASGEAMTKYQQL